MSGIWVRSQDKSLAVLVVALRTQDYAKAVVGTCADGSSVNLGKYPDMRKCERVLDMFWARMKSGGMTFEMPTDDKVFFQEQGITE